MPRPQFARQSIIQHADRYVRAALVGTALLTASCQSTPQGEKAAISESLQQSAIAAENANDFPTAIDQYQKLVRRDPTNTSNLVALARNLRYSGSSVNAVKILDKLGPKENIPTEFQMELAKSLIAAGKAKRAIIYLKTVGKILPENWEVSSTLGIAYDLEEDFDSARKAYEHAAVLSPDNPTILNNMAISAALSGDIDRAIAMLKKAPRLVRHSPQIRQNLAFFYGVKGDMKAAKSLARVDLDEEAVQANLAIYSRFHKKRF